MNKKQTGKAKTKSIKKQGVVYSAKKQKTLRKGLNFFLLTLIFIFSIALGLTMQNNSFSGENKPLASHTYTAADAFPTLVSSASALETISPSLTPTPTPTASPSPTLTPTKEPKKTLGEGIVPTGGSTPGSGYCLYVPVLYYHHVAPEQLAAQQGFTSLNVDNGWFDQQMSYLMSHGYNSISLQQLVTAIQNHQTLPVKSFAVTLDDGYADAYTYAYPIFQKYHIQADLFIPSGLINNPGYLTWDQLKDMQGSGLVHIDNHTWSHSALGGDKADKIKFEMETSQQEFKTYLGITPTIMAYPYGSYSPEAIQILQAEGFAAAYATLPGQDECSSNLMKAPRVRIGNAPMATYGF